MKTTSLFAPLESTTLSVSLLGGKAYNLQRLLNIPKIKVPTSYVISTQAFQSFINCHWNTNSWCQFLLQHQQNNTWQQFKQQFLALPLPSNLAQAVEEVARDKKLWIVRSSAINEDCQQQSLAGQYTSIIACGRIDNLSSAIKQCWLAGLFTFLKSQKPAINLEQKAKTSLLALALVLQEVIWADKSGVMFSQSPQQAQCQHISANWGSCHSIADGTFPVDSYLLPSKALIQTKIRHKTEYTYIHEEYHLPGTPIKASWGETVSHFPYAPHVSTAAITERWRAEQVLQEQEIEMLNIACQCIKQQWSLEMDIEWSFQNSQLYILQARPISTLALTTTTAKDIGEFEIASFGMAQGSLRIINHASELSQMKVGEVLMVDCIEPTYIPAFEKASAILSSEGSVLCHAAIVARELGIPCLIGINAKMRSQLHGGEIVQVDAQRGKIIVNSTALSSMVDIKPFVPPSEVIFHLDDLPNHRVLPATV